MEILFIFLLILLVFSLVTFIMPWVNLSKIHQLREDVDILKKRLQEITALSNEKIEHTSEAVSQGSQNLTPNVEKHDEQVTSKNTSSPSTSTPTIMQPLTPKPIPLPTPTQDSTEKFIIQDKHLSTAFSTPKELEKPKEKEERATFEHQFGARLPVWLGGIALVFAGFFLVKYSIEMGFLGPISRILIGLIFGCGLLIAGNWMRSKPDFANGTRIAQALSGAGVADLYICIFAAHSLYGLLPAFPAFVSMAVITALAVFLSLKHGMPIAMLGLIGGFVTPAMVGSSNPQAPILFIYLFFVVVGLMVVIRKNNWWRLAIATVLGAFCWVGSWLLSINYHTEDTLWLGLFLIALCAIVVAITKDQPTKDSNGPNSLKDKDSLKYLTIFGTLILSGFIAANAKFGFMEWGLFGLLSLGGIALAHFNQKIYGFVPLITMVAIAILLMTWETTNANAFAVTTFLFALLFITSGYLLQFRSSAPLLWATLASATSVGYYLLGYYNLRFTGLLFSLPLFWGSLALILSILSACALLNIFKKMRVEQKQYLLAIYAATSSTFLSIALTIELQREFLSVAIAARALALALINIKLDIKALRYLTALMAGIFGIILLPQFLYLNQIALVSLTGAPSLFHYPSPIVQSPVFQLGLPALLFFVASYILRKQKDDKIVEGLEISAIGLFSAMTYFIIRKGFTGANWLNDQESFFEGAIITNIFFVYSLVSLWIGKNKIRPAITLSGQLLLGFALFRVTYYDIVVHNPLWSGVSVGNVPLFNALAMAYGLPILWIWMATTELQSTLNVKLKKCGNSLMLLLSFILLTLNIRQVFQGTYLNSSYFSNAEIYIYSVAWLLFGIGLLLLGTFRKNKMLRTAALVILVLAVAKVFLYDARELEGLLRVFSFLGLGLSLLALSWFYTKFAFNDNDMELSHLKKL